MKFPANHPDVIAVGGTVLTPAPNPRGFGETVWSGTGSGCSACSAFQGKPSWQTDTGCGHKTNNDVSANRCGTGGWFRSGTEQDVIVACTDTNGTPADTAFMMTWTG